MLQALSQQVLQPWLTLEGPSGDGGSGASLADAIAYSLATPGAFLHTKLEVNSFSHTPNRKSGFCYLEVNTRVSNEWQAPALSTGPAPLYVATY